jgi:hypothetical protein
LLYSSQIDALEIKSNAVRRENADPSGKGDRRLPLPTTVFLSDWLALCCSLLCTVSAAAAAKQAIRKTVQATPPPPPTAEEVSPAATGPTGQEAAIAAMMQNMKIPGAQKSSGTRKQTSAEAPDEERCVPNASISL